MKQRVITGVFIAAVMLACVILQGWFALVCFSVAMLIATREVYRAIRTAGMDPVRWAGYMYCILIIISQAASFFAGNDGYRFSQIALLIGVAAAMVRLVTNGKIAVESMMATFFPMLYPGMFFIALMNLLHLPNRVLIAAALFTSIISESISDVFALLSGMLFGKHKLSPQLSPKKTIEGAIGAAICCAVFTSLTPMVFRVIFFWDPQFVAMIPELPPFWVFAIIGVVVSVVSQIGDLAASMVKRHCGVKDFGTLLPGHGGIMDRVDGILFSSAACYVFFSIISLH